MPYWFHFDAVVTFLSYFADLYIGLLFFLLSGRVYLAGHVIMYVYKIIMWFLSNPKELYSERNTPSLSKNSRTTLLKLLCNSMDRNFRTFYQKQLPGGLYRNSSSQPKNTRARVSFSINRLY